MHMQTRYIIFCFIAVSSIQASDVQHFCLRRGVPFEQIDLSPAGFMQRRELAEVESKVSQASCKEETLVVKDHIAKEWAAQHGISHYYEHFRKLAISPYLTRRQKLAHDLIMIPFFLDLEGKPQEESDVLLAELSQQNCLLSYEILRLFFAAIANAVNLRDVDNGFPLCVALNYEDTSLVQKLLEKGISPNIGYLESSPLAWCQNKEHAQLLIKYGANVYDQNENQNLINRLLILPSLDENEVDLMRYFALLTLPHLNKNTQKELRKFIYHQLHRHDMVNWPIANEKLKLLLELGYDRSRTQVLDTINSKKIEERPLSRMKAFLRKRSFARAKKLFLKSTNNHFDIKQDIVPRLHTRGIYGGTYHNKKLSSNLKVTMSHPEVEKYGQIHSDTAITVPHNPCDLNFILNSPHNEIVIAPTRAVSNPYDLNVILNP